LVGHAFAAADGARCNGGDARNKSGHDEFREP
jgi:hypothetical protein